MLEVHYQDPKLIPTYTHRKESTRPPTSPWNATQVSKRNQTKLFQKVQRALTCPLLLFTLHVTQIPTSQRHLPKGSGYTGSHTSLLSLPQALAACFLQLIWSDRQSQVQALGPEVCDTAHTTHIRGLAASQNKQDSFEKQSNLHRASPSRKNSVRAPP